MRSSCSFVFGLTPLFSMPCATLLSLTCVLAAPTVARAQPAEPLATTPSPSTDVPFYLSGTRLEIFGRVDLGLISINGIENSSSTVVTSGLSKSSFVGFRGVEDLGGGYKTLFYLEHNLSADTGSTGAQVPLSGKRVPVYSTTGVPALYAPTMQGLLGDALLATTQQPFWGQHALLGLITPAGAVLAGRLYTPAYEVFARFNPMEFGGVANPYALLAVPSGAEIRTDRTVQYRMEHAGFIGSLSWSGPSPRSFVGGQLAYETPTFSTALSWQRRHNSQGDAELSTTVLGASWRIDQIKLLTLLTLSRNPNPELGLAFIKQLSAASPIPQVQAGLNLSAQAVNEQLKVDSRVWSVGVQYQPAPAWMVIANHARLNNDTLPQGDAQLWGAALEYKLSKRTSLSTAYVNIDNQASQQIAPVISSTFFGFANEPGQSVSAVQVNLSHKF
jgi:predicted porin